MKQPCNKKGRNLLVPSLQYCQFGQDDWKNTKRHSTADTLRKSAAISYDVK